MGIKNMRLFEITYLGETNNKPSRIKIHDLRFDKSRFISCDHEFNNIYEMAQSWLYSVKFIKINFMGESKNGYILATSNFDINIK